MTAEQGYRCRVLADSIGRHGCRITTLEVRFPRIILSQFRTYGMLSYSVRSSRAVPTATLLQEVRDEPFVPRDWRRLQKGMVAGELLPTEAAKAATAALKEVRDASLKSAQQMLELGVAKEHVNRLLEPFSWSWAVVTGTDAELNWLFEQRCADDAQPEFQTLANKMNAAVTRSEPERLCVGQWHLPYIEQHESETELDNRELALASAGRCRRVSYRPFGDQEPDLLRDIERGEECLADRHLSPLEHAAMCCATRKHHAKLSGWMSLRTREGY